MPGTCDGTEEAGWRVGISAGGFDTWIVFPGQTVHTRQDGFNASVGENLAPRWVGALTASWLFEGEIDGRPAQGGYGLSLGASWLGLAERSDRPFVLVDGSLGATQVKATADDGRVQTWTAGDLRVGVASGKTFGRFVPYAALRVFGGPVYWKLGGQSATGTDRNHFTGGLGVTIRLPDNLDFTAEAMPVGERSAVAALTIRR